MKGGEERRGAAGLGFRLGFWRSVEKLRRGGREERKKKACLVGRWFGSVIGPARPGCYNWAGKALFLFPLIQSELLASGRSIRALASEHRVLHIVYPPDPYREKRKKESRDGTRLHLPLHGEERNRFGSPCKEPAPVPQRTGSTTLNLIGPNTSDYP